MRIGILTINGEAIIDDDGFYVGIEDDLSGLFAQDAKTLFLRADEPEYAGLLRQVLPRGWAWRGAHVASFSAALAKGFARIHSRIADFLLRESDPRSTSDMLIDWETAFGLPDDCVSRLDVVLAWMPSTDAFGVAGYRVYRNGALIATVTEATYTDSNLPTGLSFSYQVSAFDDAGNESEKSVAAVFGAGDGEFTFGQRRQILVGKITSRGGQSIDYLTRLAASSGYDVSIAEYRELTCIDPCDGLLYGPPWQFAFKVLSSSQSIHDAVCTDVCTTPLRTWGNQRLECIINRAKPAHTIALFGYVDTPSPVS